MPNEYKNFNKYYIYYYTKEGQAAPSITVYNDNEIYWNYLF